MNQYIVGLDIGTTKIACFIGERADNNKLRILGFGKAPSAGVEHGVVKNIRFTADAIRQAVTDASDMANCEVNEVYVGIAGQHIKSQSNRGSVMIQNHLIEEQDIQRLIDDQYHLNLGPGEEIIHVFPQEYTVDGELLGVDMEPVGVAGKRLEATFHIVTGNITNISHIRDAVHEAGLHVKGVVLEPIASAFAVLDNNDKEAGVALVDIGGGTTDIAIFKDGIIRHTSVLPLAGNVITKDIQESCNILKHQAESLKTRFGSCLPTNVSQTDVISIPGIRGQNPREISLKALAGIIRARMQLILEQVAYEIELSGYGKNLIAGIVLTGGGSELRDVKSLAEFFIGSNSRIGIPDEHLDKEGSNPFDNISHPMYATGIGLVIYGLLQTEQQAKQQIAEESTTSPQTEPEPTSPSTDTHPTDKNKKEKDANLSDKLSQFFSRIFTDDQIEDE